MDISGTHDDLFPPIEPFEKGSIALDGLHVMYWEQSGNPDGQPVVFLHGGPGAGASANHRRFFDPRHYRIIIFDQRGSGRSTPFAETRDNTTRHLVSDMERLRAHLGVERWTLFGGSWGSSLALAYAIAHPDRCTALVLRGIFLCRAFEVDWFLNGMRTIFPEAWRDFAHFLPEEERDDVLAGYWRRLSDSDPGIHQPAARAWGRYETRCSTLHPPASDVLVAYESEAALALARLEAHYFRHAMFMEEGYLLDNAHRLANIPGTIVQGRYDVICPIVSADALARAWPLSEYVVVPDAGHSVMEPGIRRALVTATERLKGPF